MTFPEDDLLPISALQHLAFCERQWALIHLEGIWMENRLTVEGKHLHERADTDETQVRGDIRIARGLRLRSLRLGLSGRADVVEFHKLENVDDTTTENITNESPDSSSQIDSHQTVGILLPNIIGRWRPIPIEYKHGRVKKDPIDEVQLCAQALCLEEMLHTFIPEGFLFYGKTRRRHPVTFDDKLRKYTESLTHRLHMMNDAGITPTAIYEKKCDSCSLYDACLPKATDQADSVKKYLDRKWQSVIDEQEEEST